MGYHGMYGFGIPWIGGYMGIIILILVMASIVLIIKSVGSGHKKQSHPNCWNNDYKEDSAKALEILKGRYAKGEIKKETFEKMKKDLI